MSETTIYDLIIKLDEATRHLRDQKKIVVREIHDPIREAIKPIVQEAGLEWHIWDITIPEGYGGETAVIKYGLDFEQDNRYKHDRVGRLNRVTFSIKNGVSPDDTVEVAIKKVKLKKAQGNLERLQKELDYIVNQVEEYKGYVAEVQSEIVELVNGLKK